MPIIVFNPTNIYLVTSLIYTCWRLRRQKGNMASRSSQWTGCVPWGRLKMPFAQKGWIFGMWLTESEGPPLQIGFHLWTKSHPLDRRLSQRHGGIFLTTYKMHRAVNHGMNLSELQRKINLLNKGKFFLFSKLLWLLLSTEQEGRESGNESMWLPSRVSTSYPTAKGKLGTSIQIHILKCIWVLYVFLPPVLRTGSSQSIVFAATGSGISFSRFESWL